MTITYTLTRTKRKTIALYIRNGALDVRAPLKMPKRDIDKFVASKEKWIKSKIAASAKQHELRTRFSLTYGDRILYRGRLYPIAEKNGDMAEFKDERFCIPPGLTAVQIKQVCVQLYRMLAKRDLGSMVHDFAKRMSLTPSAVKISNSKARWGSCSVRRNLNFSWRLIMADDEVIEYIIVHELAHIAELNHSTRFWSIVESAIPDYKAREKRLKELYEKLCAENW